MDFHLPLPLSRSFLFIPISWCRSQRSPFPSGKRPPKFEDKYKEREYLKGRLAAAFRIFGKYGFDEGIAGHITLRDPVNVSFPFS